MRVGSSFSRLNANTPAVNGKLPGTFSFNCQRRISPSSSKPGSTTFRTFVPESVAGVCGLRLRPHVEELPRPSVELGVAICREQFEVGPVTFARGREHPPRFT